MIVMFSIVRLKDSRVWYTFPPGSRDDGGGQSIFVRLARHSLTSSESVSSSALPSDFMSEALCTLSFRKETIFIGKRNFPRKLHIDKCLVLFTSTRKY